MTGLRRRSALASLLAFACLASVSIAQEFNGSGPIVIGPIEENPLEYRPVDPADTLSYEPLEESPLVLGAERVITEVTAETAEMAQGAVVRALDKIAGERRDITLRAGEIARWGLLELRLGECRYPVDNPEGDAFAWLVIGVEGQEAPVFSGWMIASSPALNAMDHHRYDVWVIRCTTS
ncbi:hypothetical protein SAMN05216257_10725 [Meinhardsimonia xiamenensis]|uniref:DUF2155 domain-containing protein n=1 Tax=Meinhardsimonia xiamenensis TaxID=990712 RepID=A0A1G9GCG2_9RHOB|nr:DUF2155 domain-containing protein [Meinhardsimonia xiamenensis]PRX31961.1 uncharacterized protein DUF2155 [Meinhardsimonia xiamenensis]SDK98424.1 hypothetical protein SAMN05216257_10725 [Meinhardsimonia xiamenensis]